MENNEMNGKLIYFGEVTEGISLTKAPVIYHALLQI